jgi:pimeloyl-ACP methyl ester carboxylesterase
MDVPLDYDAPAGRQISVSVARLPATDRAHRQGALLVNFGGPGDVAADVIKSFTADSLPALNDRFDIVAMDPRGVGGSRPAISCGGGGGAASAMRPPDLVDVDAMLEKDRGYVRRCVAADPGILAHVSTANVARDMDLLRRALGERRIGYFGQSYGTLLGATYARLFPRHVSAMVLDAPLDPDEWLNHPLHEDVDAAAAREDALRQFLASCPACGFGGSDPAGSFDALIASLARHPVPAHGRDRRPVGAAAALAAVQQASGGGGAHTQSWARLARALSDAANGDGTRLRVLADGGLGTDHAGHRLPSIDRFVAINASEQRYPRRTAPYVAAARRAWALSPHFGDGYGTLVYSLWPIRDRDAYRGPFTLPPGTPVPLVVAATHDPVTPIANAPGLIREMGRGRLLTVDGNGHTMYPGNSACLDAAVEAYFRHGTLPPRAKRCAQD